MDRNRPCPYPVQAMAPVDSSSAPVAKGRITTIVIGTIVLVFLVAVFLVARSTAARLPKEIVLYWGEGCPHCANVETFVQENQIESRVPFTRKEVYVNKNNAREMGRIAKSCGLSTANIGVPFLWTGQQCLTGDRDIIAFFQQYVGVQ